MSPTLSSELFWALLVFVVVTLITPGPNNTMLLASGLNFGFRRGLPHLLGVALGFGAMVLAVGVGLGAAFQAYPAAYTALKYVGAAYLLWLAWQIATAGAIDEGGEARGRPITFLEASAFQWLNPKGWVMAVGAVTTYAAVAAFPLNVLLMAFLFGSLGLVSSATWLGFGTGLKRLLTSPRAVRAVNVAMALLLVASLWPILADAWR
jgi:threonine/homoserine/homoserine lactone efflux protein